jgi:hypothetical protein
MSQVVRTAIGTKRVVVFLMFIITLLYLVLVLFPSYWSGLYYLSKDAIWDGQFNVPFYMNSGSVRDSVFPLVPIFVTILSWYAVPFLSVILLVALGVARREFTRTEKVFWIAIILIVWLMLYITSSAAHALVIWIVD